MIRITSFLLSVIVFVGVLIGPAIASDLQGSEWVTGAVGGGLLKSEDSNTIFNSVALLASGNISCGLNIFSVRYTRLVGDSSAGDLAALYERAGSIGRWQVSAGIGFGLLYHDYGAVSDGPQNEMFEYGALAWSAEALRGTDGGVGYGVTAFGSVAGNRSFGGLAFVLSFGRLSGD